MWGARLLLGAVARNGRALPDRSVGGQVAMRLRRLEISNYRGVRHLVCRIDSSFMCLVGPGDSTKTTVLDALGLVLSARYNLTFTDADFYNCDVEQSIVIAVAVADLPDKLVEERSHGKNRSGIDGEGNLYHDPINQPGVKECLIVRLTIDQTLEPVWEVVRPGDDEGEKITAAQRAELGFFRIGEFSDPHLRWGRTSALTSLTSSRTDATHAVVEAQRQARKAIHDLGGTPLHEAAAMAQKMATRLGSAPFTNLRPGLDPSVGVATSALMLHEGQIPLVNYGLGSRRLTSLAIQENALPGRSVVAIDEVEHGLDPHRLVRLVRYLRSRAAASGLQVILTTHSPIVVEMLAADEIFVVRSDHGETVILPVPSSLENTAAGDVHQGIMRARPSALLARRVIVGEGPTECGLIKQLIWRWDQELDTDIEVEAAALGVAVMDGGGASLAPVRAAALARLGYATMVIIDGDVVTNKAAVDDARAAGVEVQQWSADKALEDVVVEALPLPGLQEFVDLAVAEYQEESVCTRVSAQLGAKLTSTVVSDWIAAHSEETVRQAIARTAKGAKAPGENKSEGKAWFKREDRAEQVANLLLDFRNDLKDTEVAGGLGAVKTFTYAESAKRAKAPVTKKPQQEIPRDE